MYFRRLTDEGVFGSKFVTVCVTGNKDKEIHMEGYQVQTGSYSSVLQRVQTGSYIRILQRVQTVSYISVLQWV